ncbi:unnamed protein product [Moneuplotes crassus]|uniref:Uncharacterized protein n=1 Tax=Euplotes crassus TaxID=5936 RepID=A0AAD1UA64_EUPCR|nr:unnamed protein product [Moneuplotes crassus]
MILKYRSEILPEGMSNLSGILSDRAILYNNLFSCRETCYFSTGLNCICKTLPKLIVLELLIIYKYLSRSLLCDFLHR